MPKSVCWEAEPIHYTCRQCPYGSPFLVNFRTHLDAQVEPYICKTCNFSTFSLLVILIHQKSCVRKPKPRRDAYKFYCNKCSYKCKRRDYFEAHVITYHTDLDKIQWIECAECGYKANCQRNLKAHHFRRHNKTKQSYKCDKCSFQTKRKDSFQRHVLHKHTEAAKIPWFKCAKCSFRTKHKQFLNKHVYLNHTENIELFHCYHCEYKTKRKHNLKAHIYSKHTPEAAIEWFKCEHCDYKTKRKAHVRKHSLCHLKPEEINWLCCDSCPYRAKQLKDLQKHSSKHATKELEQHLLKHL